MGVLHLRQRVALVDANLHLATGHHIEQIVSHFLRALAGGDVGKQGLARHVDRALGRQNAGRKGRGRTGGVAKAGHQAQRGEAVQRLVPGVFAHRVIDHLHAFAASDFFDARQEIFGGVVDGVSRAVFFGQRAFGVRARGANQLQAHRLGPLASDQADTASSRVKEHKVARVQPALGQSALEQVLRGQALEHHGRTGLKADGVGQLAHAFGGHHAHLTVAARRVAGVGGAVARFEVGHALPHRLYDARAFHAQLERHGEGVEPAALVHVDVVQANGVVANANLAGAGLAHLNVHQLELLGAAGLFNQNGFRHKNLQGVFGFESPNILRQFG